MYNDKDFVAESLESLVNQSFKDFDLLVIDDYSTDGSERIVKSFERFFKNFKYIRNNENYGISVNMERSITLVDTKYLMWAGDDDLWSVNFVESAILALESDVRENYIGAFGKTVFINSEGNQLKFPKERNNKFDSNSTLWRIFKLIYTKDDTIGYAVFRTKVLSEVKFPVWSGSNKKVAYNNIFPSLLYYMCSGRIMSLHITWFNRLKSIEKINHLNHTNYFDSILNYWRRRYDLIIFSSRLTTNSSVKLTFFVRIYIGTLLFLNWFLLDSFKFSILRTFNMKRL